MAASAGAGHARARTTARRRSRKRSSRRWPQSCPERAIAGWGRRFRIAIQGVDPRTGRQFIWHLFHARPGGGASTAGDGWQTGGEGQAAGGIKFGSDRSRGGALSAASSEHHEFRPDSSGDGRYRGGAGLGAAAARWRRAAAVAQHGGRWNEARPVRLARRTGRAAASLSAALGRQRARAATKEVGVPVLPGDVFLIESSGGGGWRTAGKRDRRRARERHEPTDS